jgi:glycosyltransferase involved in cell wall biosynthesis
MTKYMYRIAYLTSKDPHNKRESSGVYYYQSKVLEKYCGEVHFLGPVKSYRIIAIKRLVNIFRKVFKFRYNHTHNALISRIYGWKFSRKLRKQKYDFIFADKASAEIAYLKTEIPVIYSTDATFFQMHNYYPGYSDISGYYTREGNYIEKKAHNNAALVLCASQWAADSAINDYNYHPERTYVLPRGANIDLVPDAECILQKRKTDTIRLLYMGKDWYRKGFDIAYETMQYIRSRGFSVKLTSIGMHLGESYKNDPDLHHIQYVDKNTKEGLQLFDQVFMNADFYLLPTRAECMGIAFCESSAYGLPAITRDTGGVSEVVKNGINGYALEKNATAKDFGEKIIEIFQSEQHYYELIKSSRKYFEERLNWDIWGQNMKKILDDHFAERDIFKHSSDFVAPVLDSPDAGILKQTI